MFHLCCFLGQKLLVDLLPTNWIGERVYHFSEVLQLYLVIVLLLSQLFLQIVDLVVHFSVIILLFKPAHRAADARSILPGQFCKHLVRLPRPVYHLI